ncbi:MAG: L-threonylcarbamoyladenylate synthase [Deltaproteobacteria bacterium]
MVKTKGIGIRGKTSAKIIKACDPESPETAASILNGGGVIVYPTETLYGIGALASFRESVEKIFEIKGRPHGKAIPLLLKDTDMLERIAEMNDRISSLSDRFWPGPLTLVVKEISGLPELITSGAGKVAVRVSDGEFVKRLFKYIDQPLCSTSANLSGAENILECDYIVETFEDKVDLIVDSGNLPPSKGSTILDITVSPPEILREGDVSAQDLKEFF